MWCIISLIVVLLVLLILFLKYSRTKSDPKIDRVIVCDKQSNRVQGSKKKFSICQENYEFFVENGQIIGFKNLKKQDSSITYYEKEEGYTNAKEN